MQRWSFLYYGPQRRFAYDSRNPHWSFSMYNYLATFVDKVRYYFDCIINLRLEQRAAILIGWLYLVLLTTADPFRAVVLFAKIVYVAMPFLQSPDLTITSSYPIQDHSVLLFISMVLKPMFQPQSRVFKPNTIIEDFVCIMSSNHARLKRGPLYNKITKRQHSW